MVSPNIRSYIRSPTIPFRKGKARMWVVKPVLLFVLLVFLLPALATLAWWALQDRPASFSRADWTTSGVLPKANANPDAAVYLLAARTGGLKGAFSVHSWIVFKKAGATSYERYDKVGWGSPVRHNAYPADGRWYSNMPSVVHGVRGSEAEKLIPQFEAAIASYPYATRGGYKLYPGPNSNSFIAHLMRSVPDFRGRMPPNAIGRDFAPGWVDLAWWPGTRDLHATIAGLFGVTVGLSTLELQLGGLVAGLDWREPALIVPALGRVPLWGSNDPEPLAY